jgi:3-hydroxyacyl-CoA dehydrogenase
MTQLVSFTKHGNVGVVALNNPPVNALSHAVRIGLSQALTDALADSGVGAIVIWCEGRTFVAGADIREFGKPPLAPDLPEVVEFLSGAGKPVIAALHGTALGGGLELALACDFRIAAASTKLGLPEVTLGILPGAGGTQRLPRLIGVRAALDMIVGGGLIPAAKALALGLIDEIAEGDDLKAAALAFAERALAERRPLRKLSEASVELGEPNLFEDYERTILHERRGFLAPLRCIQAVRAAAELPFREGLERERELFRELMASPESKAQRHVFFAEREVLKSPHLPEDAAARAVKKAGVVGDGSAAGSIAACFADARIPVTLLGTTPQTLDREFSAARQYYARAVMAGTFRQAEADERLALIKQSLAFADLADADLVVEAVSDDLAMKREVFAALDTSCKPGAILATQTSRLDIDQIAALTRRPEDVLGMHFFAPAETSRGLENARARRTLPEVCATAMKVGRALGKVPVLVTASAGLVGERMLEQSLREACFLVEEGAEPAQVDRVLYDFGFPLGPFAARERAGLKIPDAAIEAWLVERAARRTPRRTLDDREILERCLFAAVNEGARILEEGIAPRPLEIDMIWIHGQGFPVYRGGPMFWADQLGLTRVYQAVLGYRDRLGQAHWNPAPLLERLAQAGKGFYG